MKQTSTFLLVEDNEDDAFFFNRAVERLEEPIQTRRVRDGQQAIDYLLGYGDFADRTQYPLPNLLILDLKMPVCSGYDFLEWKRQQPDLATLPAIVMTSSPLESDVRRCYELGAHSFTTKVATTEMLRSRLAAMGEWWLKHCITEPAAVAIP